MGCTPASHSYVIKKASSVADVLNKATLEVVLDEDRFLSVSVLQNPEHRAAMSQSLSTAYQSTTPPSGTGSGEMVAAYVITAYLFRAGADSNMHSKASGKALALVKLMKGERSKERVVTLFRERFKDMESIKLHNPDENAGYCENTATVCPQVQLSNDLRMLEVKVDFSVTVKRTGEVVYKNSFIYLADPAPSESRITYWADADARQFFQALDLALGEIVKMIDLDFLPAGGGRHEAQVFTIKYRNEIGTFYERGTLLRNTNQRIVLRDLRGNLRSLPGELL